MPLDKIKDLLESAEAKLKSDPKLLEEFKSEPVKTLEKVLGVDLPDEQIKSVAEMLKAKLAGMDAVSAVSDMLGGLFGKKD